MHCGRTWLASDTYWDRPKGNIKGGDKMEIYEVDVGEPVCKEPMVRSVSN